MNQHKQIHFIAIGGAVMHYLAIHLDQKGYTITGSDDEIFEPSASRLRENGLHPEKLGWDPSKIHKALDGVILGMHAKADNPELKKAQELGIRIYSFPEFVFTQAEDKHRVVVAGSHGKTTITAMIIHVLRNLDRKFDFLVGAKLDGFDNMVKLSEDAPLIILEGDEYPSSALDKRPKFLNYHHHVAVISGISWDHINAFPTIEDYVGQFDLLADSTPKGGALIFSQDDDFATIVCRKERADVAQFEYTTHPHVIDDGQTSLVTPTSKIPIRFFGEHNLRNINAAKLVCSRIGVSDADFYKHIQTFNGAKNRLELVTKVGSTAIFKDFAHAPSKVKATVKAVKTQYPFHALVACLELHTYSSLNKDFIHEYSGAMANCDVAIVYYNPHAVALKKLTEIPEADIKAAFNRPDLQVFNDSGKLEGYLKSLPWERKNLLLMSSGNFNGLDISKLSTQLT